MKGLKMNLKATKVMAGVLVMLSCAAASAQDGVIRARAGISANQFSSVYSGGPMKSNYNSLNTGVTYIQTSGWYYDAALKNSLSAKWSLNGTGTDSNNGSGIGSGNDPYKRQDITLTFGKALESGIQVFGGYQQANSKIDLGARINHYEEEFNVKGFFAGVGKTIPLAIGSMNINGAVGQMKGRLLDGRGQWNDSDKGNGYSAGATYSYPLADKTTLSLEYKRQQYKYTFGPTSPNTGGNDKLQVFGANISYQF